MIRPLLSVATLAVATLPLVGANKLTPVQKAEIVTRFSTEVKYNFAHFRMPKSEWDSICSARLPQIVSTATDEAFLDSLKLLCATLKDGHTAVWRSGPDAARWPLPFFTKRFGDRVFVTDVITDETTQAGVRRGTEILELNDMPVIDYGEKFVMPFMPSSTPQWSHNYAFFGDMLTNGLLGQTVKVKFCNAPDSVFTLSLERVTKWPHNPYDDDTISCKQLTGNVGYIKIPSFQQGEFEPNKFIEAYDSLESAKSLIIDVRDNGGGNSGYGDFVLQLICPDTIPGLPWSSPQYIPVLKAWGEPERPYVVKGEALVPFSLVRAEIPKCEKPVVLLVNANSFSAAEDFAATFKAARRGVIIGTPTGGSTGQPMFVNLGHGYKARICARNEWLPDGTKFIGEGIIPDVIVEETPEIFNGRDVVIEKALEVLK